MNSPARPLFLVLLLTVPGCVHVDLSKLETPTAPALLKEVDELEGHVESVKGSGRVQAKSEQGNGEVGAFIAARAPGDVHLELLDFFGAPARVLVSDGRSFGLYQRDKGSYLHGPATAGTISRILPVELSAEDLAAILLGRTPRLQTATATIEKDEKAEAYRVTLVLGERRQTLWIHPTSKRVLRSVLEGTGGYSLLFEQPLTADGVPFARKVTFQSGTSTVVLRWSTEDVALNGPLDAALFTPAPPAGAKTVEVDAAPPGAG
jgi:outer membrane lipoprotein-sorting protein